MKMRSVVRALFENLDYLTSEDIAQSEILKQLLIENVPASIKRAYASNQEYATVFEINATEAYVEIDKSQWKPAIETIISWYSDEKIQDFEKCIELSNLIKEISIEKTKKQSRKKKTSGETGIQSS